MIPNYVKDGINEQTMGENWEEKKASFKHQKTNVSFVKPQFTGHSFIQHQNTRYESMKEARYKRQNQMKQKATTIVEEPAHLQHFE